MSLRPETDDLRVVRVRGMRLGVQVQGQGPALLLLNGLTRPMESWREVVRGLGGRTVVSFDAPGVGRSPTPPLPLPVPTLAALAVGVLDAVGVERADVLGYSLGGAVAQQLAVAAPTRVRRLVLVSTSCGVGAVPGTQGLQRGLRRPPEGRGWPRPDPVGTLWHTLAVSGWSSIPFLGAIGAPTLVVSGTDDRLVPPANSALLARRIPGATHAMVPGGHDLQRRGPAAALAAVVSAFLAGPAACPAGRPAAQGRSVHDPRAALRRPRRPETLPGGRSPADPTGRARRPRHRTERSRP